MAAPLQKGDSQVGCSLHTQSAGRRQMMSRDAHRSSVCGHSAASRRGWDGPCSAEHWHPTHCWAPSAPMPLHRHPSPSQTTSCTLAVARYHRLEGGRNIKSTYADETYVLSDRYKEWCPTPDDHRQLTPDDSTPIPITTQAPKSEISHTAWQKHC